VHGAGRAERPMATDLESLKGEPADIEPVLAVEERLQERPESNAPRAAPAR
jgi:hypothetical protein